MKWTKTKICMLLVSLLVLHAPILQAQAQCEQACQTGCTQSCLDDVTALCMAQNPTLPPFVCANHPGYQPQRNLCSDFAVPAQASCQSSCIATNCADATAPRITSIERQTPGTVDTNADILVWRITFDEPVKNVDTSDFNVAGTTASVTGVSAATGMIIDVTVSGGDLAGLGATVTLSVAGAQNIADLADNALANTTPTGNNNNSFAVDGGGAASVPTLPEWALIFLAIMLGGIGCTAAMKRRKS